MMIQNPLTTTPVDTTQAPANLETPISSILDAIFQMPNTVVYVAVTVGLMLFVVGWFAGIKENKTKMFFSALIVVVVGFFSLRVPAIMVKYLTLYVFPATVSLAIVYFIWTFILLAMAIFLYETWIITFKEQFGKQ